MNIAKSLQEFSKNDKNPHENIIIYSKHIDAMNTVIKNKIEGDGGKTGSEMMLALSVLIKKLRK